MDKQEQAKKITVEDISDGAEENKHEIKVKKSQRWQDLAKRLGRVDHEVKNFYTNKEFDRLQKPIVVGPARLWLVVFVSIIFGLISGALASFYILSQTNIDFAKDKAGLIKYLPAKEIDSGAQTKADQVSDLGLSDLPQDLNINIWSIFKAKVISETGSLSFLDQIYAPWQIISSAVLISNDGWLINGGDLDLETDYVVVDQDNNILKVEQIITDPITGVNFLKVSQTDLEPVNLASAQEIYQGRQVVVLDKFKNQHLTEISQAKSRNIYKTEDLVRSTDKFVDFIRLDFETPLGLFPMGLIFGLDKKLIGLVIKEKIVPAWYFSGKLKGSDLGEEVFDRPYLGIDYLRIEEAPGLTSDLFKALTNGAIVYGPPASGDPAHKAGIKNADVIIKVDDIVLDKDQNLTYLIQQKAPGDIVSLTVLRAGKEIVFNIELGRLE